jgi:hypothetical protein
MSIRDARHYSRFESAVGHDIYQCRNASLILIQAEAKRIGCIGMGTMPRSEVKAIDQHSIAA